MRAALDAETIMVATEDVLRKHGPAKATVVDVARALGVTHAAVYRHFPSKAALREAVVRRWLTRGLGTLAAIASDAAVPPPDRLRAWVTTMFQQKREGAVTEPDLWATVGVLAKENNAVIAEHVNALRTHLETIIAAGLASGDFAVPGGAASAARTILEATALYHAPSHASEWQRPDRDVALDALITFILRGLHR